VKAGGSASTIRIRSTVERLLVRTWNVFHGNTKPPTRKAFLEQMVRLASSDGPAVLCLQELPVWSLSRLESWSRMTAIADVTRRPTIGPFPSSVELGRILTELDHGLFRSAFTGQANAILFGAGLRVVEHRHLVLNSFRFRRTEARRLGLDPKRRRAWGRERRVLQAVRAVRDEGTFVIGNVHATGSSDRRLPDAELLRAAVFVDGLARPDEPVLLCGDFNLTVQRSRTLESLTEAEWGFTGPTPVGIDHILVRGRPAGAPAVWPVERRTFGGRVLSDHPPVEREVA
jgi:endonuclease/exonuclease/phosphatase family metal-dependent hydrolase